MNFIVTVMGFIIFGILLRLFQVIFSESVFTEIELGNHTENLNQEGEKVNGQYPVELVIGFIISSGPNPKCTRTEDIRSEA